MVEAKGSVVRWQGIAREHLSRVSDLVLGLASGAIAFLGNLLLDGNPHAPCAVAFALASFVAAGLSVLVALWGAVNRLKISGRLPRLQSAGEVVRQMLIWRPIERLFVSLELLRGCCFACNSCFSAYRQRHWRYLFWSRS